MTARGWRWLLLLLVVGGACAERRVGGSLRGALEALQRRQRAHADRPRSLVLYRAPRQQDYEDALYDLYGPSAQYDDEPYSMEEDDLSEDVPQKYIVKYLNEAEPSRGGYYESKKKKAHSEREQKPSAFRERSSSAHKQSTEDESLKQLFADGDESKNKQKLESQVENDVEYAMLLDRLWSKYKNHHPNDAEPSSEGIVKLYKERTLQKRSQYPDDDGWGPVAFKRKRSPPENEVGGDGDDSEDNATVEYGSLPNYRHKSAEDGNTQFTYTRVDTPTNKAKDTIDETVAFQSVDGNKIDLTTDGDDYSYEAVFKRFPVTKRSSGSYDNTQKKRSTSANQYAEKKFRTGAGTDPKVIRDLSKIFGEPEEKLLKSPVKRSNNNENSHESKAPQITAISHNQTHDHEQNATHIHEDDSHEHQGHSAHPPNVSGKEEFSEMQQYASNSPISFEKKSIDWSQYFGIDKRKKKLDPFRSHDAEENYRTQYRETFNREMGHSPSKKVKRDFIINKPIDESKFEINRASIAIRSEPKRNVQQADESKLDNIDKKLAGVESVIVDEALHMSNVGDLDSDEQQELKEKMLSRLAAAYSLEKMRKALKSFKQSLNANRDIDKTNSASEYKEKRIAVKKEKAQLKHEEVLSSKPTALDNSIGDEFEGEQGAGHYVDGGTDEPFSEGYMGGSGRHRAPGKYTGGTGGNCPVLERIVQRCRSIDLLAGDQAQVFLPLCSLHQICYLCGESAPTNCDLIFLSEADTACEGDGPCSRAARGSLMAMRELHESLADDLDGECEASPCLADALRQNIGWSHAVNR